MPSRKLRRDPNNRHPILRGIATSFSSFTYEYNLINSNLLESFLINNPVIWRGERDNRILTLNFFQDNIPRLADHQLVNLKVKDIADGNLFLKRLDDIAIPFSILTYMRLQTAFHVLRNKLRNRLAPNIIQLSLTAFLKSFKKGSQSIRRIFTAERNERFKSYRKHCHQQY